MNKLFELEKTAAWPVLEQTLLRELPETLQHYRSGDLDAGNFLRLLFIQRLYNLNEMELEDKLIDRPSYRRFAGLKASDCPAYSRALWEFRRQLEMAGNLELLMERMEQGFSGKRNKVAA